MSIDRLVYIVIEKIEKKKTFYVTKNTNSKFSLLISVFHMLFYQRLGLNTLIPSTLPLQLCPQHAGASGFQHDQCSINGCSRSTPDFAASCNQLWLFSPFSSTAMPLACKSLCLSWTSIPSTDLPLACQNPALAANTVLSSKAAHLAHWSFFYSQLLVSHSSWLPLSITSSGWKFLSAIPSAFVSFPHWDSSVTATLIHDTSCGNPGCRLSSPSRRTLQENDGE